MLRATSIEKPSEINPTTIANSLGIDVAARPLVGLDGCLLRLGTHGAIIYRDDISSSGRVRFTIAHEVGHWILHSDYSQSYICTGDDIGPSYRDDPREREANSFAASLLMPITMVRAAIGNRSPDLDSVQLIADKFETSLSASAYRLVEASPDPVVLVVSEDNVIQSVATNDASRGVFIRRGTCVNPGSESWCCTSTPSDEPTAVQVDASFWFPEDRRAGRYEVEEQPFRLGSRTYTLLTVYEN